MIILGIETSCDETAICLLEVHDGKEYKVLSNIVLSQINIHKEYGGVYPMVAKREHSKHLVSLLEMAIKDSGIATLLLPEENLMDKRERVKSLLSEYERDLLGHLLASRLLLEKPAIDRIAVTHGPGLEPALWVGVNFTKALHILWDIPVVTVNHMEGHVLSPLINPKINSHDTQTIADLPLPSLSLLISGGHTELVRVDNIGSYTILGATKDDAVGEAFDKVARMLGLPYPGGPEVSKRAEQARQTNLPRSITLPRPMIHSGDLNFSFSGLKTAVLYALKKMNPDSKDISIPNETVNDICREFEESVTEVLIKKTKWALDNGEYASITIGGGVIANSFIRKAFETLAEEYDIPLLLPHRELSGDNALMIALAGSYKEPASAAPDIRASGNLSL